MSDVLEIISPRSKKQQTEVLEDYLASPTKQREIRKELEELDNLDLFDENEDNTNTTGWINPDLVLEKKNKVLQTSTLGHGNEHKDEDLKELSCHLGFGFNDKTFYDVLFRVGPQQKVIYGHKVIIGNRSIYFKGIFSKTQTKIVELSYPEFSPNIFQLVIQYMYSGIIELKLENVLEILHLSEKFNIRSLSALCCDFIQINLDFNNVSLVLEIISKYNQCQRLYQYCLKFIDKNILSVLKSKSFTDLSEELVILVISRDEIEISTNEEIEIFNAVLNWAKNNSKSQEVMNLTKVAEKILPHIRFPLMPKAHLTNVIEPSKFVPQYLLMEAYKNQLVPQQSNHERFTSRLINEGKRK
eukprot:gene5196-8802_t